MGVKQLYHPVRRNVGCGCDEANVLVLVLMNMLLMYHTLLASQSDQPYPGHHPCGNKGHQAPSVIHRHPNWGGV